MTVKKLIEMLQEVDPDLHVYVCVQSDGIFGFQEACEGETGECDFGPPPEGAAGHELEMYEHADKGFVILPHGFGEEQEEGHHEHLQN